MKKQPLIQPIKFREDCVVIEDQLIDLGKITHIHIDKEGMITFYFLWGNKADVNLQTFDRVVARKYYDRNKDDPHFYPIFPYKPSKNFYKVVAFLKKRFKPREITEE